MNLALPSLRADNFNMDLMENIQKVRKSGLTFAPEAGSQRLRDVINKNLYEQDLLDSCAVAFAAGYNSVKLYFMMGLPTETEEDLAGIAAIVRNVIRTFRQTASTWAFPPLCQRPKLPFSGWGKTAGSRCGRSRSFCGNS